jgi:hypothetical protein
MTATARMALRTACFALVVALGACSSGNPFTTGTLLGGGNAANTPAAPPPETPTDRTVHVGTTSARAQRCGYVFDPAAVRQGYLAFEAQQGLAPDVLANAEKSYDYTVASISKTIAANEDYCSDAQTAVIKRDLAQVLAGDYSSPNKKVMPNVGWWTPPKAAQPMDREKIFNPTQR